MNPVRDSDCSELLLDLLWYEIHCRRLSPEMESILACHLSECAVCRAKFSEFACAHEKAMTPPQVQAKSPIGIPS